MIKVSWRDPGQNAGFWLPFIVHWSSNLPSNVEKWTFWRPVRPDPAKVREKSCVWSERSWRTPLDLPNFNLNYSFFTFSGKLDFSRFTNKCLARRIMIVLVPKVPTLGTRGAQKHGLPWPRDSWGGLPPPPHPPTFFVGRSRGLPENSWGDGGKSMGNPLTNPGFLETQISAKSQGLKTSWPCFVKF